MLQLQASGFSECLERGSFSSTRSQVSKLNSFVSPLYLASIKHEQLIYTFVFMRALANGVCLRTALDEDKISVFNITILYTLYIEMIEKYASNFLELSAALV